MGGGNSVKLDRVSFRLLMLLISGAAVAVVVIPDWVIPESGDAKYLNGLVAFTILAMAADSSFLKIPRISFANISSSVVFIPFIASVALFDHPWPTLIAGVTAFTVDTFVQRKPLVRAWFNTAQYALAVGLGGIAYKALGGPIGLNEFAFRLTPFLALAGTFFVVNQVAVSLAIAFSTGVSVRESWTRIVGGSIPYDFVASALSVLLAFLYVHYQFLGLAVLILPLFFVRHMYQMALQFERVNRELLELMVKAIEARDPYTSGHSLRVSEYAQTIARELGLSAKRVDQIASAALMHDVGKIYEEFAPLLRKEGKLTPDERMLMQKHPMRSAELAATIKEFRGEVETDIRHHHENYDGTGYPNGISGKAIPVGARIIMIADTIDAMTTDRPYRKALTFARAIEELKKFAGTQFDPELVDVVSRSPSIRRLLGPQLVAEEQATHPFGRKVVTA